MKKAIIETLKHISLLLPVMFREAMINKKTFLIMGLFMFIQNLVFFMIWVVFFDNFSDIGGWGISEMATLLAVAAFGFGIAFLLCGGVQEIARKISNGDLDVYLGQPRHALVGLMFRDSRSYGIGDLITAPVILFLFTDYGFVEYMAVFAMGILAGVLILATTLAFNSLAFFAKQGNRIVDQLFECFMIISLYPHNGFGIGAKILLMTIVPAGFIANVPINAISQMSYPLMGFMVMAAIFYMSLAIFIFNQGLKRYTSGNMMHG